MDPGSFLHAVFVDQLPWVLGGSLGSLAVVVWSLIQRKRPDDTVLWPVVIAIFVACGLAWNTQHDALVTTQAKVKGESPSFAVDISQMITMGTDDPSPQTEMYVAATVRNSGAPSIAEDWIFGTWTTRDGYLEGHMSNVRTREITDPSGQRLPLDRTDALYEKTLTPIERGALKKGWLRVVYPDIAANRLTSPDAIYFLWVHDIVGKEYRAVMLKSEGQDGTGKFVPGVKGFEPPVDSR